MSIKILKERQPCTVTRYYLNFHSKDSHHADYSFPLLYEGADITPCKKSLTAKYGEEACEKEECTWWPYYLKVKDDREHYEEPDEETLSWNVIEPAIGLCKCGKEITLMDQYMGACQCPYCGHWYNLFGQELLDPEYWEEDV